MYDYYGEDKYKKLAYRFIDLLWEKKSTGYSGVCWGYNFDWQSRAFFLPRYTPTVVATSFIANSFLDAYEVFKEERFLKIARSSCDFICHDLNRTYENDSLCFSYSPLDQTTIHNANILGAHLLSRTASYTDESKLKKTASSSVRFVIDHQNPDGSWYYGTQPHHQWVDNFHTGFVLECLFDYINFSARFELRSILEFGLEFYLDNFFLADGAPKYYSDHIYPIDIHSCAQSIITLDKLSSVNEQNDKLKERVVLWTLANMHDPKGYFYFQKKRFFTDRIAYMRWSQAWMLKALVTLVTGSEKMELLKFAEVMAKTNVGRGFPNPRPVGGSG